MPVVFANRKDLQKIAAVKRPARKSFGSGTLRFLAFSDYRVQDHSLLLAFAKALNPRPDLILYAGDDIERFHNNPGNTLEELARASTLGLCAVIGNDAPSHSNGNARFRLLDEVMWNRSQIRGKNVLNVHETPLVIGDYAVIGNEGAPLDENLGAVGTISYPEELIATHLKLAAKSVKGKRLIVLSHSPPRNALDTAIRFGRRPIGSKALRKFLNRRSDVCLVVCGHVHSCGARTKRLNRCHVVNAASHDDRGAPGRIAIIDIQNGQVQNIEWHQLWELASIPGIGEARESMLRNSGISDLSQLRAIEDEGLREILKCGRSEAAAIRNRALALINQKTVLQRRIEVPSAGRRAFIDIETDLACKWIWLIGLHVESENRTFSFFARALQDEKRMLAEFLAFADRYPDLPFFSFSNSRTEERMLSQRLAAHDLPVTHVARVRDLYSEIHSCAAFPLQGSMGLKAIAAWCGFKPRTALDGFQAAHLYGSGNVDLRTKQKLLRYNEDDVLALKHVILHLEELGGRNNSEIVSRTVDQ
ncbi:MAG TPA: ribonuclease H-like domain-containing protein [Candidatus Acidoferrum sp.]|nr:ribonuclease H-like domain-containing protein [Candidatus Acidoferrum sp.]